MQDLCLSIPILDCDTRLSKHIAGENEHDAVFDLLQNECQRLDREQHHRIYEPLASKVSTISSKPCTVVHFMQKDSQDRSS